MSDYMIQGETLTGIADAIRSKAGLSQAFTPAEMIDAIENMEIGTSASLSSITFSSNGTYTPDTGYDGFDRVTVDVPVSVDAGYSMYAGTVDGTISEARDQRLSKAPVGN